jgi:hypothetical protein
MSAYSVPDDRKFSIFPNLPSLTQGTNLYVIPSVDSRKAGAPQDCRRAGAPVDCRVSAPQNCRVAPK